MSKVSITTQKDKNNPDLLHVYLRLNIGQAKRLKKVCSVEVKSWNAIEKKAHGQNAMAINKKIQILKSDLEKEIYQKEVFGKNVTLDVFENKLHKSFETQEANPKESILFFDFAKKEILLMTGVYAKGTVRHYKSQLMEIRRFYPQLSLTNISYEFLQKYEVELQPKMVRKS